MSSIDDLFGRLKSEHKTAFMPFITAGDPSLDFTARCLQTLDKAGCHLIELGIPYSDPIADGPTIQASYTRALNAGTKLDAIMDMMAKVSPTLTAPVVSMISYAIIFRLGVDEFLVRAKAAGFAGAIVPDMPVDESAEFATKCKAADFSLIQLVTPTTSQERAAKIIANTTGFIYYVSVTGITGERTELPAELVDSLKLLGETTGLPICVGFGISKPEHAQLLAPVADGLIVGSAIVRHFESVKDQASQTACLNEIEAFAQKLLGAIV